MSVDKCFMCGAERDVEELLYCEPCDVSLCEDGTCPNGHEDQNSPTPHVLGDHRQLHTNN